MLFKCHFNLLCLVFENIYPHKKHTYLFLATLFELQKNQKTDTTQTSCKGQKDKLWYIHTMEYHSDIKRNKLSIL